MQREDEFIVKDLMKRFNSLGAMLSAEDAVTFDRGRAKLLLAEMKKPSAKLTRC
jgi:hypothetical protein